MATYKPLQSFTLTSNTVSVTFSGIDQTYTDLVLQISSQNTSSTYQPFIQFNADLGTSTTLYSTTSLRADGSSGASGRHTSQYGWFPVPGPGVGTTGNFQPWSINIANYSNTTTFKSGLSRFNNTASILSANAHLWRNTNAINSITITAESGAGFLAAGSTFDLYGIKSGAPKALGGDLVTTDGNYWYHTFRSSGTFSLQQPTSVDYLVVAGGGAGGYNLGGGGGAGGLRSTVTASGGTPGTPETALSMAPGSYTVTVGAGGAGTASASALTDGSNSVFATITSTGGGGGAIESGNGRAGGSGGGGSRAPGTAGAGTTSQGRAGGIGTDTGGNSAGGGGGAGAVGGNSSGTVGGTGGAGVAVAISGSSVTYAGGGGGVGVAGGSNGTIGQGGAGGGGASGNNNPTINPIAGTANTGGGGGGGENAPATPGGNGGSGIVIVRYPV
jgi:hypothetical protein